MAAMHYYVALFEFFKSSVFQSFKLRNHGLYGSTNCCISHKPCQWERAIIDPTALRSLDRFS